MSGKRTSRSKPNAAPPLYYGNVPESQQEAVQLVGHALDNLAYFAECFEADLKLFDKCAKDRPQASKVMAYLIRNWQFVAARDGAISIFNFSDAINSLIKSLRECPHIKSRLDYSKIEAAQALFDGYFPNAKRMRDSVGHAGDKATNAAEHRRHGYTGRFGYAPGKQMRVKKFVAIDHLAGRRYTNTWRQKVESYRISSTTLKRVYEVTNAIFDAFNEMNARWKGQ